MSDKNQSNKQIIPDITAISKHSGEIADKNDNIINLFPDIERAMSIIVSSIVSPTDISKSGLQYEFKHLQLDSEVQNDLLQEIRRTMLEEYSMDSKVKRIVEETYITHGAYATLFISDEEIKRFVNAKGYDSIISSLESDVANGKLPKELKKITDYVSFETDINVLEEGSITLEASSEGATKSEIRKRRKSDHEVDEFFKALDTREETTTVGVEGLVSDDKRGIIMRLPVSSIVPIPAASDPNVHLEYYVLFDENGVPVDYRSKHMTTTRKDAMDEYKKMIGKQEDNVRNMPMDTPVPKLPSDFHEKFRTLENTVKRITHTDSLVKLVDPAVIENINALVLSRALRKQHTRVFVVPASNVSYIRIDTRPNGTGESKLEKIANLISMRAIAMMSRLKATVKANMPRVHYDVDLFDDDPQPQSTIAKIVEKALNTQAEALPILGSASFSNYVQWAQAYGVSFKFKHPMVPTIDMSLREYTSNNPVDNEVESEYKKQIFLSLGVPPEFVEQSMSPNFAANVIADTAMFRQTIRPIQEAFDPQLTQFILKHIVFNGAFKQRLVEILNDHKGTITKDIGKELDDKRMDTLLTYLLKKLSVSLPSISVEDDSVLAREYKAYKDNVESYIQDIYDLDGLGEASRTVIESLKFSLYRKWLVDNNYMTEILEAYDDDGISADEELIAHYNRIIDRLNKHKRKRKELEDKIEKYMSEDMDDDEETPPDDDGGETPDDDEDVETPDDGDDEGDDEGEGDETPPDDEDEGDETPPEEGDK